MKAIKPALLVQTVTLYNIFKDPQTGDVKWYRTILERVRIMNVKTSFANIISASMRGVRKDFQTELLADRRNTLAYQIDGAKTISKPFRPWQVWRNLIEAEKAITWTLNEGDLVAGDIYQPKVIAPEFDPQNDTEDAFRVKYGLRPIAAISPQLDKDGSIHHWRVNLD
jgi:hypothetical protein